MQHDWESRVEQYRSVARELRRLAAAQYLDFRRQSQLRALADGFDRLADRVESEAESP